MATNEPKYSWADSTGPSAEFMVTQDTSVTHADATVTEQSATTTTDEPVAAAGLAEVPTAIDQQDAPAPTAIDQQDAPVLDVMNQSSVQHQQLLLEAQAEIKRQQGSLLRMYAENDNLRKRAVRDVEQVRKYGLERIVGELLTVKDTMALGIVACQEEGVDLERIRVGMEMTLKMLHQVFDKFGVQTIDPSGEVFDPQFHEAMTVQAVADTKEGTVLQVIQQGYLLNGRLIRPAKVIVAK